MACVAPCAYNMDNDQEMRVDHPAADGAPADLSHIEAINNLDTARMALRWALERIQSLQLLKDEAQRQEAGAAAERRQAEEDRKDLQRVLELRSQEDAQRAAYYAKLEAYLSQHFAGKLDLAALIKREVQTAELEALLHDRQLHLENEYAARRERLEAECGRAKFESQQAADEQTARAKASVLETRKNLEHGFAVKLAELTDKEVRLKAEEVRLKAAAEALAQRQVKFEAFSLEQRARLELDIKAFQDSVEDQIKFRVDSAERFRSSRHDAASSIWQREKAALLNEIDEWREQSLSYLPRLSELQKKLGEAEAAAQRAKAAADSSARLLDAGLCNLQTERAALAEEVTQLRRQREADLGRLLDLERKCAQSDEDRNRFSVLLLQEKTRVRELQDELARREAEWRGAREAMAKEKRGFLEAAAKRLSDVDALEALLLGRFQDLEDEIHRHDLAWKEREEVLRTRDRNWHTRLSEWQAELNCKSQQLETLKAHLLEIIQSYKAKLDRSENPQVKN